MSGWATLEVDREEAIVFVRLDRPEARNALNLQMCLDLRDCFEVLAAEDEVRVVVIEGNGPVFCAGADLKERDGKDAAWVRRRRLAAFAAYRAIEIFPKPAFALAHGPVIGSGGEICLSSDFILASTEATFRFPEPQWGTVGATQRLQRAIGKSSAKELLFTGRTMGAAEALQRGLVARCVEPGELKKIGREMAEAIAAAPAQAMRLTKQAVDLGNRTDLETGLRIELAAIEQNLASGEWQQGVRAFSKHMATKSK